MTCPSEAAATTGTPATGICFVSLPVANAIAFYLVQVFVGTLITGPWIHESMPDNAYRATSAFWRPELRQNPPDMAASMPYWITVGLISAFCKP